MFLQLQTALRCISAHRIGVCVCVDVCVSVCARKKEAFLLIVQAQFHVW